MGADLFLRRCIPVWLSAVLFLASTCTDTSTATGNDGRTGNIDPRTSGRIVVRTEGPAGLWRIDLPAGRDTVAGRSVVGIPGFALSGDGATLAYASSDTTIDALEAGADPVPIYAVSGSLTGRMSVDGDGLVIAFSHRVAGRLMVSRITRDDGNTLAVSEGRDGPADHPLFSRNGSLLAWRDSLGVRVWWFGDNRRARFPDLPGVPQDISPAGRFLATDSMVLDLVDDRLGTLRYRGTARFLSEEALLVAERDPARLTRLTLNGQEREVLTTAESDIVFGVSPDRNFAGWFWTPNGGPPRLILHHFDHAVNDTLVLNGIRGRPVAAAWRDLPLVAETR